MRISDWSSDVCSSDLVAELAFAAALILLVLGHVRQAGVDRLASGRRGLEPFLHPLLGDVHLDRRLERAVGQLRQIFARPRHADVIFDIVVSTEEPTSELQSLMRISYAVFCLQKNKQRATSADQRSRTDVDT